MAQGTGINIYQHSFESPLLVEEISSTEFYVGVSNNSSNTAAAIWKIKRILKTADLWEFNFPNGNQGFEWVWDDRFTYDYK